MTFNNISEKFIFYKLPAVLFSLIPFFLITGPFLSDSAISIISLLFIIYCIKKKNFSYFKEKYFYFFLVFWIYLLLNSIFNNFNLDSLKIYLGLVWGPKIKIGAQGPPPPKKKIEAKSSEVRTGAIAPLLAGDVVFCVF